MKKQTKLRLPLAPPSMFGIFPYQKENREQKRKVKVKYRLGPKVRKFCQKQTKCSPSSAATWGATLYDSCSLLLANSFFAVPERKEKKQKHNNKNKAKVRKQTKFRPPATLLAGMIHVANNLQAQFFCTKKKIENEENHCQRQTKYTPPVAPPRREATSSGRMIHAADYLQTLL